MYSTLRELKRMERYYNKFVIKQNYERCYEDIQKDRDETRCDSYKEEDWNTIIPPWEEDWQFIYDTNN